jgi:hypothetical protein
VLFWGLYSSQNQLRGTVFNYILTTEIFPHTYVKMRGDFSIHDARYFSTINAAPRNTVTTVHHLYYEYKVRTDNYPMHKRVYIVAIVQEALPSMDECMTCECKIGARMMHLYKPACYASEASHFSDMSALRSPNFIPNIVTLGHSKHCT